LLNTTISLIKRAHFHARELPCYAPRKGSDEAMTIIEIRAGEGGQDAKLLVEDQLSLYVKFAARRGL
jgi:protein subunit release factor A